MNMLTFGKGSAIFFDFDGVLIDSVVTKTQAYRDLFAAYEEEMVARLITYHQEHGGISRVEKIKHAFKHFIDEEYSEEKANRYAARYSKLVFDKVVAAPWIAGAEGFVKRFYSQVPMFIISGTPQDELREIVVRKEMESYFEKVLGSPVKKPNHVRQLVAEFGLLVENCFFIGDAMTDYRAAHETGVPFIGIEGEVPFPENTTVLPDCCGLEAAMVQAQDSRSVD